MGKKTDKEYTTIQIRKEINALVRKLCQREGWIASLKTEQYWLGEVSASMSGSITI